MVLRRDGQARGSRPIRRRVLRKSAQFGAGEEVQRLRPGEAQGDLRELQVQDLELKPGK